MTVTIRGHHPLLGIEYEVSGSSPGPVVKTWNDLLDELSRDAGSPKTIPQGPEAVVSLKVGDDVFHAEKMAEKADTIVSEGSDEKPAPKKADPSPPPKPAADGAVCSDCQKPLSESEARTSKLFVSKPLCRLCMQNIVG